MHLSSESSWLEIFEDLNLLSLIDSGPIRRLDGIDFLGTVTEVFGRSKRVTRLAHSVRVALLANLVALRSHLTAEKQRLLVAASLLHDIGHTPLSHVTEPFFFQRTQVDHHAITLEILRGKLSINRSGIAVSTALRKAGVSLGDVQKVLRKNSLHPFASLLRSPINIDTLAGIGHCAEILGLKSPDPFQLAEAITWKKDHFEIAAEALGALREFWQFKSRVYNDYIYHPRNLAAEVMWIRALDLASKDAPSIRGWRLMTDAELRRELSKHSSSRVIIAALSQHRYFAFLRAIEMIRNRRVGLAMLRLVDFDETQRRIAQGFRLDLARVAVFPKVFKSFFVSKVDETTPLDRPIPLEKTKRIFRRRTRLSVLVLLDVPPRDIEARNGPSLTDFFAFERVHPTGKQSSLQEFARGDEV